MASRDILEKLHRYSVCNDLAKGQVVVDLCCGEGYGPWLLSSIATRVRAFDASSGNIAKARETFGGHDRLSFDVRRSGDSLPLAENEAGLVVVTEAEALPITEADLREVVRILRPDGVLLVGTRGSAAGERALTKLENMLRRCFKHVAEWGQVTATVSLMADPDIRASNADSYRGYTRLNGRTGQDLGPGMIELPEGSAKVFLCTNSPFRDPPAPSMFVMGPDVAIHEALVRNKGAEEDGRRRAEGYGVFVAALGGMLSRLTGRPVTSDLGDLMDAMRKVVEATAAATEENIALKAEQRLQAAELARRERVLEEKNLLRSVLEDTQKKLLAAELEKVAGAERVAAAKREQVVIRAETDTAIAQRLAQQRRVKRLRLLTVEASEQLEQTAAAFERNQERADKAALAAARFASRTMHELAAPAEARYRFNLWQRALERVRAKGQSKSGAGFFVAQGDAANRHRDWALAASHYAAALLRDWTLAPIWVQFGHALKEQGFLEDAGFAYREAARADPSSVDALTHLAHLMKRVGDDNAAMQTFKKIVQLDPENDGACEALGKFQTGDGAVRLSQLSSRLKAEAEALD
jgi:hypothetical protein